MARPDFLDGPPRHPDLCLWYVRLWPHAAEDKSRTAFLAPDASMVLSILMVRTTPLAVGCWCFSGGLEYPKSLHPMGLVSPFLLVWGSFTLTALRPRTLCPFQGAIPGALIPEEPLGGYIPLCLTGAISHEPLPPSCRPGACSLPDGEWLLPCLAERPPTTRREVFAFDKRVSRCVSCVGHFGDPGTERWSFWRLSEGGSVATISLALASGRFSCFTDT